MALHNDSVPPFMEHKASNTSKLIIDTIQISIPSLKDKYVTVIPNAFSENECKEWIDFSEEIGYKDALVNLGFGHQQPINEFRNHKKLTIDNINMATYIFDRIKSVIPTAFNNRKLIDINERLRFLRYAPNQYFGAHYDGMFMRNNGQRSLLTIIIYLNDNYNGGEITFLHPIDQNKTHSIKPQTGMVLLFEQNELFHEGSIVLSTESENVFKYCIRSDIMYSKELIDSTSNSDHILFNSYEVEKQKVYFERKQKVYNGDINTKPKKRMNTLFEDNLTTKIIHFWVIESCISFPFELYEGIATYCRIIRVLDFVCHPKDLERLAQAAETAERYKDMMELITQFVKLKCRSFKCNHSNDEKCELITVEQRNLLSVAYKNVVGELRASWRTLHLEIETLKNDINNNDKLCIMNEYIQIIEMELKDSCFSMLDLLENHIIKKLKECMMQDVEAQVFYMKCVADYNRYLAEIFDNKKYKEIAQKYYCDSYKLGTEKLGSSHPTLLGLGLNYAVYLYEIAKEPQKACDIAKVSFDDAIGNLDGLDEQSRKDSTLVIRLLRDNMTLWRSDIHQNIDE